MGVILTGHIDVPEERLTEIEAALAEHMRLTRQESGCRKFEVTPDLGIPGRFNVSEEFVDRTAFEFHQARGSASEWGRVSAGLHRDFDIRDI